MALKLSALDARRFLARYHLETSDVAGVFERLGSVQYDPLKPLGRNHDLVLQARVPGYRVGDWERTAYQERLVYDAWDKQACLVPVSDWPYRRLYHSWHYPHWRARVFEPHAAAVEATLSELAEHGPLSSLECGDQTRHESWRGSWYGPKLVKHILRALWDTGRIVTHHRRSGRHYYHLPERVIPETYLNAPKPDDEAALRWLIRRRHQNVGLLRPGADVALWSMQVSSSERKRFIAELVEKGELVPVMIEGALYHMPKGAPEVLEREPSSPRMVFLAPLDNLLWDRRMLRHVFNFDYVWEVYKPEAQRKWGYYVLPVFYGDRLVARFDSRLMNGVWTVHGWWWEEDVATNAEMLEALTVAAGRFLHYLRAEGVDVAASVEARTRQAILRSVPTSAS